MAYIRFPVIGMVIVIVITVIVLALLMSVRVVKMTEKVSIGAVAQGDFSGASLNQRLQELEKRLAQKEPPKNASLNKIAPEESATAKPAWSAAP